MIREVIIFTIMLCPMEKENICISGPETNNQEIQYGVSYFHTAVTPWKKVKNKTIYIQDNKEVEFEK